MPERQLTEIELDEAYRASARGEPLPTIALRLGMTPYACALALRKEALT